MEVKKKVYKNSKIKKTIVFIILTLITIMPVYSQDNMQKIDLDDAIALSLSNNLDLQSARINVEIAKNDVKTANRLQNPEFNIFYNFGSAGKSEPQQMGLSEVIEIAKRAPRKKLAKSNLYKKELDVKLAEFTLEMDVRETYVDLVGAKSVLACLNEQKAFLEEILAISKKRLKCGAVSETDVIQVQIALNQLETRINTAKTALKTARNDFNKALNISENSTVLYDTKEDYLPGETVFISLKTPDYNQKMPSFDLISTKAMSKRLDIKSAEQEVDIAKKNLVVVERQRVPNLEVVGGYSYLTPSHSDSGRYAPGAYAGANLQNIPLLYAYKPEIKNAKLQVEQAQINYESAKNKAIKDLNSAYERFLTSQTNLVFYKQKLIKDSENLLKISKQNYNDGKTDLTSVIVMEQSYCEIVVSYLNALTDYYTDWIDFLREVNSEDFSIEAEDI